MQESAESQTLGTRANSACILAPQERPIMNSDLPIPSPPNARILVVIFGAGMGGAVKEFSLLYPPDPTALPHW